MVQAVILVKISPNIKRRAPPSKFAGDVERISGVVDAYAVFGRFDYAVFLEAAGLADLRKTVDKVVSLEGVKSSETLIETS